MGFFRMLKETISPSKKKELNASDLTTNITKKRKYPESEDNPFNEKTRNIYKSNSPIPNFALNDQLKDEASPFIRNHNLSKSLINQTFIVPNLKSSEAETNKLADKAPEYINLPASDDEKKEEEEEGEEGADLQQVAEEKVDEDDEVTLEVLEEMSKLEECFPILSSNYRLIDKIGEGTFSTVYKAEALNGSIKLGSDIWKSPPLKRKKSNSKRRNPIVALKQIYVTSSPNRIHNELNLLYTLTGNSHVAPLLDVLRYQDQVLAILPYYQHADFRDFYRDLPIKGIKKYLWELFHALDFVHDKGIIHRDLKPTNFLYDPFKGKGVLVDFGLAEKFQTNNKNSNICPCQSRDMVNKSKRLTVKAAYPKQDQRPPRRANRAGTRGFRAPEVLFKCTNQSTKLDIWSAGIIGFSLISRKFPLFNSPDDIDALLELTIIFGIEKLQKCAEIHGCGFEINLSNMNHNSGNLIQILSDFLRYEWDNESFPPDSMVSDTIKLFNERGDKFVKPTHSNEDDYDSFRKDIEDYQDHKHLIELLNGCFQMDQGKRLSAKAILKLPFFQELINCQDDEVVL